MKRTIYKGIVAVVSALSLLASCQTENDKGIEPDKVYLPKRGVVVESVYDLGTPMTMSLWTDKSGRGKQSATVTYSVDESLLAQIAADDPTKSYTLLPASCYTLPSQLTYQLAPGDEYAKFDFSYDPATIVAAQGGVYGAQTMALPLRISVSGDATVSDEINDAPDYAVIVFNVMKPVVTITNTNLNDLKVTLGETGDTLYTLPVGMNFDNQWDVTFGLETDPAALQTLVDAYNAANNSNMRLLDPTALTVDATTATLPQGTNATSLAFRIDRSKVQVGASVLPLRLADVSSPLYADENAVAYLVVRGVANRLDRTGWTASAHTFHAGNGPEKLLDGAPDGNEDLNLGDNYQIAWKSEYGGFADDNPYVIIDMQRPESVAEVEVFPRYQGMAVFSPTADNSTVNTSVVAQHNVFGYTVYASLDGVTWTQQCDYFTCPAATKDVIIDLYSSVEARYVKVEMDTPGRRTPTNKSVANTVGLMEVYLRGF
jgi:hypothetical protein